ncbi:hypothetical protein D3C86_2135330 [compost metagenome]
MAVLALMLIKFDLRYYPIASAFELQFGHWDLIATKDREIRFDGYQTTVMLHC